MIVVDASAMTEFLLQTPLGSRVETRLFRDGRAWELRDNLTAGEFKAPTVSGLNAYEITG